MSDEKFVTLRVDSGNSVYSKDGMFIGSWNESYQSYEAVGQGIPTSDLAKLKNAGFSADEIALLRQKEII